MTRGPVKVLIVDDSAVVRKLLSDSLAGADDIRQLRDEIAALRRALEAKGAISPRTKGPCRNAPTGA